MKAKRRGKGAKSKYVYWISNEGVALIEDYVRSGMTNKELAKAMNISEKTLYEWQKVHSKIGEALKNNKEVSDAKVENETFKLATGFYYPEEILVKTKITRVVDGVKETVETMEPITIQKYKPADPTTNQFWLLNRRNKRWQQKQNITVEGGATPLQVILSKLDGDKY